MNKNVIKIKGAKENNLKNIDITLPKNKLIIITGPSGSGKSTLAFDTIYAEGKRRYIESLSSYARQFLGGSEKPKVDLIEGLSPSISIDQKSGSNNPRSTVGTITEIYDYLRLLYARIGVPHCPKHHIPILSQSAKDLQEKILKEYKNQKIQIIAEIIKLEKGTHQKLLEKLQKDGYIRVLINGEIYNLLDDIDTIKLDKNKKHNISIIVDRIKVTNDNSSRLLESLEKTIILTKNEVMIDNLKEQQIFSTKFSCPQCDFTIPELEPRLFSFNSPIGACKNCSGLGDLKEPSIDLIVPDKNLSLNQEAIRLNGFSYDSYYFKSIKAVCEHYNIDMNKPFKNLNSQEISYIFDGTNEEIFLNYKSELMEFSKNFIWEGIKNNINRRFIETKSDKQRRNLESIMSNTLCPKCKGSRLNIEALSILINDKNIDDIGKMSIKDAYNFFNNIKLTENQKIIGEMVFDEIKARYNFLINVGLDYLNLSRSANTLSGGEAQRIRLATQIGSKLTGVLYVLDEPSIGLHQRDNDRLINTLKEMRDLGNTLIVVEHDEDTILNADYIVDIGPGSGSYGGEIVAKGTLKDILKNKKSLTGQYLNGNKKIEVPEHRRKQNHGYIEIKGATENNLKNVNVKIPKNNLVCITGVSGSGKSTLINSVLYKNLYNKFNPNEPIVTNNLKSLNNIESFKKIIKIDQKPIGKTPRSNPATYVGVFDDIRDLFASLPDSQELGYLKGRFSFNVPGGRCDHCEGDGIIKIEMNFLPDVYITCEKCNGKRYNDEVLNIKYKNKNISDVLQMEIREALEFFNNIPKIKKKLETLVDVGLGYLKLGTPSTVLSGGEAQRIKISKELQKNTNGETLYLLDEPTTGLHIDDVKNLIIILQRLVDKGNSMIIIEHNLELIKISDYMIDLGPSGGNLGGEIVAYGPPEKIINNNKSLTGKYLKKLL